MVIFLPLLFSIGRFIPIMETLITFFILVILIIDQCALKKNILKYFIIVLLFIISGLMGTQYQMHIDHIKPMIIIFLSLDACNGRLYNNIIKYIEKYYNFIEIELVVVLLLNIFFSILDIGYSVKYGEAWGMKAFCGIYSDPHQCAYHICVMLVTLLWLGKIRFKSFYYWILVGFEYCTLITGARAPTFLAIILGLIFVVDHFVKPTTISDISQKAIRYAFILVGVIIVMYIVMKYTSFGYKMASNFMAQKFDNGRGVLRERDWELFLGSNVINKIFGNGTDAVIAYHGSFLYSAAIWSHNDFTQILVGMGASTFLIYVAYWFKRLKIALKKSFLYTVVVCSLIFVAYINGLYIHTRLTFVLPLLFMYMESRLNMKKYKNMEKIKC